MCNTCVTYIADIPMPRSTYNLITLSNEIRTLDSTVEFLKREGLLNNATHCKKCDNVSTVVHKRAGTNYHYFACPNCHTQTSVREGSIMAHKHTGYRTFVNLCYTFIMFSGLTLAQKIHEVFFCLYFFFFF